MAKVSWQNASELSKAARAVPLQAKTAAMASAAAVLKYVRVNEVLRIIGALSLIFNFCMIVQRVECDGNFVDN